MGKDRAASLQGNHDVACLRNLLAARASATYARTVGPASRFTFVSDNCAERLGFQPQELYDDASRWWNAVHEDGRDRLLAGNVALRPGPAVTSEYRVWGPAATWQWVTDERRVLDDAGTGSAEIVGAWTEAADARRDADTSPGPDEFPRYVAESIPTAIASVDTDQHYRFCNRAYAAWFGRTVAGIIGISRDVSDVMNAQEALRESEAQRKGLMRQVLTVQEKERPRIARELHGQVAQDLASVLVDLRVIESAETAEAVQRQAGTLRDRTANALEDVRPNSLDDLGLAVALERALSVLAEQSG
ncbi:MAG: histidine kinase, partial [Candidatus Poribacteria bacterium]